MLLAGSILLSAFSCSQNEEPASSLAQPSPSPAPAPRVLDLSEVLELRITGKTNDAIELLRSLSTEFPDSAEVLVQLGRSLVDANEFALAAFRFEQAVSLGASREVMRESAEAHFQQGDIDSSIANYTVYLSEPVDDPQAHLSFARLLAQKGRDTDALNAFSQAPDEALAQDCLLMGALFAKKKLYPQAKHWFRESSRRSAPGVEPAPLLGLLQVAYLEKNDAEAETLILALEKSNPGSVEASAFAQASADLLRKRRLADFIARGVDARGKSVSELASALFAGVASSSPSHRTVVSAGPKLPANRPPLLLPKDEPEEGKSSPQLALTLEERPRSFSLAEAFASPLGEIGSPAGATNSKINESRDEYLNGNYTTALLLARDALKEESTSADAWQLCSQAHFQLGEIEEAEMTILEAIRHAPLNLEMRMDYLRIARETLPGKRYLFELEKARELFPESTEILWELARRYEIVEKMPVTAAVLYRKIIEISPPQSALSHQAEMELQKFQKP
jgi:tetratricopeptide (TPR) repeat protein